ncbi:PorV/PorQ family protein [Candidatus Dependentiae bacterium]|nr:PorV/PorQ family protein [Candidatus Dependentiae bacterium]
MKKFLALVLPLLLCATMAFADVSDNAGTAGAVFLKIPVSARASAMGDAFVSLTNDANAIYWNPAGLTKVEGTSISFTHQDLITDIAYEYIGGAFKLDFGTLGFGVSYLHMGDIDKTTAVEPDGTGETFTSTDMAIAVAAAKMFGDISFGLSLKYISEKIDDASASTPALDIGLGYMMNENLSLGLAITNIGGTLKWDEESDPLPMTVKAGIGYMMMDGDLVLSLDLNAPSDADIRGGFGVEYTIAKMIAIRAGYKVGYDIYDMTAGIGIKYGNFAFDFAYVPVSEDLFGNTQKFSLSFEF